MATHTGELIDNQSLLYPESSYIEPLSTRIGRQVTCLSHFFEQTCERHPNHIALICGSSELTYRELDRRANRLAHLLLRRGLQEGQSVGIYMERSLHTYVALLAVLKAGGTFVPLDPSFPADRVAFIAEDANLQDLLTSTTLRENTRELPCRVLELDAATQALADQPTTRPQVRVDPTSRCYIIYTSGTTGRPKGVGVTHANITNFLQVVTSIYDVRSDDRIYQGMSIAFDFSFEEIWPTWIAGATLIAGPTDSRRLGQGLTDFLMEHQITVLYCVPTLLATIDQEVTSVRSLFVGGEACPPDLVHRWSRPERRMLNTYGPTETTVTATYSELFPDRPVTIGRPLPTYHVYLLDEQLRPVEAGGSGEICIGGPGVAMGYLHRPDLTRSKFIANPILSERAEVPRLYRSGDLGRLTPSGEIEYLGRIDTQVKIRGYRIELSEIESVLLQVPEIGQAVVNTYEPEPGVVELVAYYTLRKDSASLDQEHVYEQLHGHLPTYMIPAYFEELAVIPMLPSGKADRKKLPEPTGPRGLVSQQHYTGPTTDTERTLAEVLAQVMRLERVSVESHFFDDLGANSLLMARFCARVRERAGLSSVSIKDVYLHPTIRSLAAALEDTAPAPVQSPVTACRTAVTPTSTRQYILCGTLQFLLFLGYFSLIAFVMDIGYTWISAGTSLIDMCLRSLVFGCASFLGLCILPILAKWLLVGRWKPQEIRIWSLAYVRFWTVKTLVRLNPLVLSVGSPLYILYLRALGARIGRGIAIFSRNVPVCTDLLTIGDGFYIVHYLRTLGYDLSRVKWMGSNFGGAMKHEMPSLISIGADTMISDGLSIINADFSSTSFRVSRASIGSRCYLGNAIAYPSRGRIGNNCLLATKVMVPLDGDVREGVGLLGSPCFEIPRSVQYDSRFDYLKSGDELRRRIAAKNKYNTASMGLFLLERWLQFFGVFLIAMTTADLYLYDGVSAWVIMLAMLLTLVFTVGSSVLVERAATGFRALSPQFCSIYEPYFWWHERLWMLGSSALFNGTPFKNVIWRLLGVRIGSRVFDDGCSIVEKTLVTIGNDCTLNAGSIIQCHSMEDGIFKSDHTAIGANCTIGTKAYIHYGVTMGDGAALDADSFLMKGEEIGPHARWRGNPARELRNVSLD